MQVVDVDVVADDRVAEIVRLAVRVAAAHSAAGHPARERLRVVLAAFRVFRGVEGRGRQVFSAGPFVAGEKHRAILDADADAVVFGECDEWTPGAQEARPVVVHAFRPVAAGKCVHGLQSQLLRGDDHFFQMCHAVPRDLGIGIERIRIVAERGERDDVARAECVDVVVPRLRERGHVHMRSACPAGQHITSMHAKPSARANARTRSSGSSGKMAETKPSFIPAPCSHDAAA